MDPVTSDLLSIVVPLYNEQDNVVLLTKKIHEALAGYQYEIIYVDDFSTDETRKRIDQMQDQSVQLIHLKKNYGQSLALAAGIDVAQGRYIITMDGDLQNDPTDIPMMLEQAVNHGFDLVTGIRQKRKDSWVKTSQLGLQVFDFCFASGQHLQLLLGRVGQTVDVVLAVVDGDVGHGGLCFKSMINPRIIVTSGGSLACGYWAQKSPQRFCEALGALDR